MFLSDILLSIIPHLMVRNRELNLDTKTNERIGRICDKNGNFLGAESLAARTENDSPSEISNDSDRDDLVNPWHPYQSRIQFETACLLYRESQLSAWQIDKLLALWQATLVRYGGNAPFRDHHDLYATIDATPLGDISWDSFVVSYEGPGPGDGQPRPPWMDDAYEVWFRDPRLLIHGIISNPDFASEVDYAPYHEYFDKVHQYQNMMSGNWAWRQAVSIS